MITTTMLILIYVTLGLYKQHILYVYYILLKSNNTFVLPMLHHIHITALAIASNQPMMALYPLKYNHLNTCRCM